jgi:hypothetical protein
MNTLRLTAVQFRYVNKAFWPLSYSEEPHTYS